MALLGVDDAGSPGIRLVCITLGEESVYRATGRLYRSGEALVEATWAKVGWSVDPAGWFVNCGWDPVEEALEEVVGARYAPYCCCCCCHCDAVAAVGVDVKAYGWIGVEVPRYEDETAPGVEDEPYDPVL